MLERWILLVGIIFYVQLVDVKSQCKAAMYDEISSRAVDGGWSAWLDIEMCKVRHRF